MKLPARNRHWLKEVKKAYSAALKMQSNGGSKILEIYRFAPELVAKSRNIKDKAAIEVMLDRAIADVEQSKRVDPGSEESYLFHFVSAYIMGHSAIGLIEEMEADKIMAYVNDEWEIFPDA